ncbi:MAG: hypothetical protein IAF08_14970 [Rhizobacter sp.]|nr:hypothetical protein [Chlorobiales bacterium]
MTLQNHYGGILLDTTQHLSEIHVWLDSEEALEGYPSPEEALVQPLRPMHSFVIKGCKNPEQVCERLSQNKGNFLEMFFQEVEQRKYIELIFEWDLHDAGEIDYETIDHVARDYTIEEYRKKHHQLNQYYQSQYQLERSQNIEREKELYSVISELHKTLLNEIDKEQRKVIFFKGKAEEEKHTSYYDAYRKVLSMLIILEKEHSVHVSL